MTDTYVVAVADARWFRELVAGGLFDGKVEAVHAVAGGMGSFLRPNGPSPEPEEGR